MRNRGSGRCGFRPPPRPDSPHVRTALARPAAALLLVLATALSACQDPSGVGLGLIGDEVDDPNSRVAPADSAFFTERDEITYGFASGTSTPQQARVLVGELTDPTFGDARAIGYIDFRKSATEEFDEDRTIAEAQIRLPRAAVYGDTTATLPIEIREVTGSWTPDDLEPDATLETGDLLDTQMVAVEDSVIALDLPQAFVADRDTLFRGSIDTNFEGFELRVPEGMGPMPGAVLGLAADRGTLRLVSAPYTRDGEVTRDTVSYPLVEVFTSLERGAPADVPDRRLLRDGAGEALGLRFDFSPFTQSPLANAALRLPIDRTLLASSGTFARPAFENVHVFAVVNDTTRVFLFERAVPEDDEVLTFRAGELTSAIQGLLLDLDRFSGFEISPPSTTLTLGALPVRVEPETTGDVRRPRMSLVLVGPPS